MTVRTDRLDLEPATMLDVNRLMQLDSDPEVTRFINGGRPSSRDDVERRLRDADGSL